ncbi:MerR family transcriptional regulator [Rheinheimera sp. 1928-s]|uniref:MerR family transcriptional regulator n=1 Tax=Rheinheimera sp. 1928-s TaxID=3033803 RepID=UPI002604C45C|nr:MerR family transcriptional regulator [Rheinheimera sp. 1928-s]MDF3125056.1 MerR family transcriptional regulator [Rheinheimera sp. 1928-s]
MYRIGQLAKLLNVSESKLRFLEQQGVINPLRENSGYRYYSEDSKNRLEVILKAQQMGFSLKQIRSVQRQNHSGDQHLVDCQLLLPMLQQKLTEIDQQMLELQQQRHQIQELVEQLSTTTT